jgi:tRNA(His) 5'-end guanylyltransferase
MNDFLNVTFWFEVGYKPNVGKVRLEGTLWYSDPEMDKLFSEKGEKVKMEPELVRSITTAIVRESLLEVIEISKKLRLPVPIKLPAVEMKPTKLEFKKG